jgi:hypothetical protein
MANFGVSHVLQNGVTGINDLLNRILILEKLVQNKGLSLPSNLRLMEVKPTLSVSGEEFNSLLENNKKFQFFCVAVEELGKKDLQLMKESQEYTRLMVENSNDIRDIKSKLNGLESMMDKK